MNNAKIIKISKTADLILKILQVLMLLGGIICAVAIGMIIFCGGEGIADSDSSISLGNMALQLVESSHINFSALNRALIPSILLDIIMLAVLWFGIRILRGILRPMKEGKPFEQGISSQIRKLAWLTLIGGAVLEIWSAVGEMLVVQMYDWSQLFNPDIVAGYTFNIKIDGSFIIYAVILFLLAYVFQYGEMLQIESDETL